MTKTQLRDLRKEFGLRQRDMAAELGYSEDHLRHLEKGQAKITKRFEKQIDMWLMKKKLEKMLETS